jgi:exosortase
VPTSPAVRATIRPQQTAASWIAPALLALPVISVVWLMYASALANLAGDWWTEEGSSYGMLVPPLAAYVAWMRRKQVFSIPSREDGWGLVLILLSCLLFLVGQLGAEFFLTRESLVVLLAGLIWCFWGLLRLKALLFPLVLLATMVPLPTLVYNKIGIPLQLFSSATATNILYLFGVSIYRDGNILQLPNITLGVAEACSGLRSISALSVGAILVGYVTCDRVRTRALLFALAFPVAISLNVVRIAGTAVLATYQAELAMGFYHSFSGWLVFLASCGLLLLIARGLHRFVD